MAVPLTAIIKLNIPGMFLWARLVLDSVRDVDSMSELHEVITIMPRELSELYGQILSLLCQHQTEKRTERIMRTLAWVTFARRPLKRHEILHGVGVTPDRPVLDRWSMLDGSAIDKCKPIIEELPDGSIALIHFTAQEYGCSDTHGHKLYVRGELTKMK